jgi:hypothetical protein
VPLGPDGPARISFVRAPGHFYGAESTNANAPRVPWNTLRPQLPTSDSVARRHLDVRIGALERQRDRADTEFTTLMADLPHGVPNTLRLQADEIDSRFRQGRSPGSHTDLPPHLRAQHRLDTMGRAVRDWERLNDEARNLPVHRSTTPVPADDVSTLVNEVNARLRGFRGDWLGGEVDAREVAHAQRDLPQGPQDPRDLAHQIAFGEPPRDGDRPHEDTWEPPQAAIVMVDEHGTRWQKASYSKGTKCVEVTVVGTSKIFDA